MSATQTETDRLERIEAKLDAVLAKVEKFELAAAGFMQGPLVAKLFGAIRAKDG